jgi:hypothetical protein
MPSGSPKWSPPSVFKIKFCTNFSFPLMRNTIPAYLSLLDLVTLTLFCKKSKLWCSSARNFLHSPITFSRLGPKILLSTSFSNRPYPRCEQVPIKTSFYISKKESTHTHSIIQLYVI